MNPDKKQHIDNTLKKIGDIEEMVIEVELAVGVETPMDQDRVEAIGRVIIKLLEAYKLELELEELRE